MGVEANPKMLYRINKTEFGDLVLLNFIASDVDNKVDQIYVDPVHIGISTLSEKFMNNSRFAKGSKNLLPNTCNYSQTFRAPTITIDKMIDKFGAPDLIKIDVDGNEIEVLKGCKNILSENRKISIFLREFFINQKKKLALIII